MQQQAAAQGQGHQPPPQATHRPAPAPPREKKKDRTGQYTVQMEGPSSAYSMGLSNGDAKSEAVTASAYRGGPGSIGSAPSAPPAPSDDGPATGGWEEKMEPAIILVLFPPKTSFICRLCTSLARSFAL